MSTQDTYSELQERMKIGTVIDNRYEVTGYMGRGGFAGVYEATHIHLQRRIAVKVLDLPGSPSAGRQFRDRFLQEARIAARIKHPGVVDIYDFGLLDDTSQPYIAMEYLDGDDLEKHLIKEAGMPIPLAVTLFAECLEALDEGHDHGIVHKDLKPSNLFLTDDGKRLVILDFGVARVFTDPEAKLTQTGGFSGTPAYLAPEYIEFQQVTPRLDVYQMGLIFIEALTGTPAVQASSSMAYMMAHCSGEVNLPGILENTELGRVLRKATALEPEERYADAGEFRDALVSVDISALPKRISSTSSGATGAKSIDVLAETNPYLSSDTGDPVVVERAQPSQTPTAGDSVSTDKVLIQSIIAAAIAVIVLGGTLAYFLITDKGDQLEPTKQEVGAAEKIEKIETAEMDPPQQQEDPDVSIESALKASMKSIDGAVSLGDDMQRSANLDAREHESSRIQRVREETERRKAADRKRRDARRREARERAKRAEKEAAETREAEIRAAEKEAAETREAEIRAARDRKASEPDKKPDRKVPSIAH